MNGQLGPEQLVLNATSAVSTALSTALNSVYFILLYIISVLHAAEFCSENAELHIQS